MAKMISGSALDVMAQLLADRREGVVERMVTKSFEVTVLQISGTKMSRSLDMI